MSDWIFQQADNPIRAPVGGTSDLNYSVERNHIWCPQGKCKVSLLQQGRDVGNMTFDTATPNTFTSLTLFILGNVALWLLSWYKLLNSLNKSACPLSIWPGTSKVDLQHSSLLFTSKGNFITEYWWCNCIPLLPLGCNDSDWRVCSKAQRWSWNQQSCWYEALRQGRNKMGIYVFKRATCVCVYAGFHKKKKKWNYSSRKKTAKQQLQYVLVLAFQRKRRET